MDINKNLSIDDSAIDGSLVFEIVKFGEWYEEYKYVSTKIDRNESLRIIQQLMKVFDINNDEIKVN